MKQEKRKSLQTQIWEELEKRGWVTPLSTPPDSFCDWWRGHDHCSKRIKGKDGCYGWTSGITAHKAWQCACYRFEFKERGHEHAAGTGINYAYYGWHRAEDSPRTSNPAFLEAHREFSKKHRHPDPAVSARMPELLKEVRSFDDMKTYLDVMANSMNMNKAIGWTEADSTLLLKDAQ